MRTYIFNRLMLGLVVIWGVCTVVFFMTRLIPGDAADLLLGVDADAKSVEVMRHYLGLDRPLGQQYLEWLGRLAQGNMGRSLRSGRDVAGEIISQFPATLQLAVAVMGIALLVAIPLGVLSAAYRNSPFDRASRVMAMLGSATPNFWLGNLLVMIFSLRLGWLPTGGYVSLTEDLWQSLRYLILPALSVGTLLMTETMRMTRSAMLDVIGQDYIRTAQAKGLHRSQVLYLHALRNALIPVVTLFGIQVGRLLGGAVIIEAVFSRPGVGRLALQAISQRDYPMVQGAVLFIALVSVLTNLIVDILYAFINPQIRYQ